MSKRAVFETAALVPESGVYRVTHEAHRLPHEVILIQGEQFPRCAKCADAVVFELLRAAPDASAWHAMKVYELPVIEEDEPPSAAAS